MSSFGRVPQKSFSKSPNSVMCMTEELCTWWWMFQMLPSNLDTDKWQPEGEKIRSNEIRTRSFNSERLIKYLCEMREIKITRRRPDNLYFFTFTTTLMSTKGSFAFMVMMVKHGMRNNHIMLTCMKKLAISGVKNSARSRTVSLNLLVIVHE